MEIMPRPRPPHLHRETTRHGKTVWYVRADKGRRIRINADFGSPEFQQAYHAAVSDQQARPPEKVPRGTLEWLWLLYRQSIAWRDLSMATRKQRENIMPNWKPSSTGRAARWLRSIRAQQTVARCRLAQ